MKDIIFTPQQVQQIINTLLPIPAKDCFDTLLMIKAEVDKQTKTDEPGK